MPAHRVFGNRTQNSPHVGIEYMPFGKPRRVLRLQCVRKIQPLRRVIRVQKNRTNIAVAFNRLNTKRCSTLQYMRPRRRSLEGLLPKDGLIQIEPSFPSVFHWQSSTLRSCLFLVRRKPPDIALAKIRQPYRSEAEPHTIASLSSPLLYHLIRRGIHLCQRKVKHRRPN